jgi:hypothetical protein
VVVGINKPVGPVSVCRRLKLLMMAALRITAALILISGIALRRWTAGGYHRNEE